jgi:hypothetical protein
VFGTGLFKYCLGETVFGMRIFYGLCFVLLAFFMGMVMAAIKDRGGEEERARTFVILFNGMAFFVVLGFAFSLDVFKLTQSDFYMWVSISVFSAMGVVFMFFLLVLQAKSLYPKEVT